MRLRTRPPLLTYLLPSEPSVTPKGSMVSPSLVDKEKKQTKRIPVLMMIIYRGRSNILAIAMFHRCFIWRGESKGTS